jgi:hypothetical protein
MDNNKLARLFNLVKNAAIERRKSDPEKFNGQAFWQFIKNTLEKLDNYRAKEWKKLPTKCAEEIMKLPEFDANGKMIEENHFLLQQARIPKNEPPTIRKIVQIALNIGQYRAIHENGGFDHLSEFISCDDAAELSKYISDELLAEINKYLKKS